VYASMEGMKARNGGGENLTSMRKKHRAYTSAVAICRALLMSICTSPIPTGHCRIIEEDQ
jgi:hypothetical protein